MGTLLASRIRILPIHIIPLETETARNTASRLHSQPLALPVAANRMPSFSQWFSHLSSVEFQEFRA